MSFFDLSDGKSAKDTGTSFESGGGDFPVIPDNTDVVAVCDSAAWGESMGNRVIKLRWGVMKPTEYENRKVFQNLKVFDPDPKKADKAKRMLAAIDANAGGKLLALNHEPTDEDLELALTNRFMLLKLKVFTPKGDDGKPDAEKSMNWVAAVSPKDGAPTKAKPAAKKAPAPDPDDIDF